MLNNYDEAIGRLSAETNKKMLYFLNVMLEKYDITTEQWTVLLNLSKQSIINQKNLAQLVKKDQPTLTRILDILQRKGLVERQVSTEDRRAFLIAITEKGSQHVKEIIPYIETVFSSILEGISEEELKVYKAVLRKMDENLEQHINK